jgi:hypothetical protein
MFALLLISIVAVPVLIGIQVARGHDLRRGLVALVALVLIYDVLYMVMLHYLRFRWNAG